VYIFVDEYFPKDIRSTAQGLFNFLIFGLGPFVGNFLWPQLGEIFKTADGIEAFMDKTAYDSDGVMLIGRIKWHTDFNGRIESGLFKMMAIGLGKFAGAAITLRHTSSTWACGLRSGAPDAPVRKDSGWPCHPRGANQHRQAGCDSWNDGQRERRPRAGQVLMDTFRSIWTF
jgi:hypothetical protein